MADWPQSSPSAPLFLHTGGAYSTIDNGQRTAAAAIPNTMNAVKEVTFYLPIVIPFSYPVNRVFWVNGSTATGENILAIYNGEGQQLYTTGKTALSGATQSQFVTPTPFVLPPGQYYFALWFNGTVTSRWFGLTGATADACRMAGALQQAAEPPASATFASFTQTVWPIFGVTLTASGF